MRQFIAVLLLVSLFGCSTPPSEGEVATVLDVGAVTYYMGAFAPPAGCAVRASLADGTIINVVVRDTRLCNLLKPDHTVEVFKFEGRWYAR